MELHIEDRKSLILSAYGKIPCDLAVTNVQLLNVFSGEVYPATVYIKGKFIAYIDTDNKPITKDNALKVLDGKQSFMIPGLIDTHEHIESSMLTPRNFAASLIVHGTTTVVTDPHEIANVYGLDGIRYMHDAATDLPMRQFIDIPSCVPAVPQMECAGANLTFEDILEVINLPRVIGLGEVMDFVSVATAQDRIMNIIDTAKQHHLYIQGHAPFLSGRMLSAYICAGPKTCHESRSSEEAKEKIRNGMYVDARESSISKNVKTVWDGVKHMKFHDQLTLCTDDKEVDDILYKGHMNDVVRSAIQAGMDPILAIRCATLHAAREIHIENLGAIAPGYIADFLLVDSLENVKPNHVFYEGKLVAKDGKLCKAIEPKSYELEQKNSVYIDYVKKEDLYLKAPIKQGKVMVHAMKYKTLTSSSTECIQLEVQVKNGYVILDDPDLKFVAVIHRHNKLQRMSLGIVKGFGTTKGALASTVSHDSHNVTIVYDNVEDAWIALQELGACKGGMSAVYAQKVLHTLALPLAGLMSLKPAEELSEDVKKMKLANYELGLKHMENPLLRIVTLALPVIPEIKMSDTGYVDVFQRKHIPLFLNVEKKTKTV